MTTVAELIERLRSQPQNLDVELFTRWNTGRSGELEIKIDECFEESGTSIGNVLWIMDGGYTREDN